MKHIPVILALLVVICTTACKAIYNNKLQYSVSVGESIEIYYSTNSCCQYCIVNQSELKHIELIKDKVIDKGPSDCDGCNYTAVYIFKATSSGTDTLLLRKVTATKDCYSSREGSEKYIITVK